MASDTDAARKQVRKAVKEAIHAIRSEVDQIPGIPVVRYESPGLRHTEYLSNPAPAITAGNWDAVKDDLQTVSEVAEWLYESGNGYHRPLFDDDSEQVTDPDKEDVEHAYARDLRNFTQKVLAYTGSFQFSENAFTAAYEDHFKPYYSDKSRYEVLIPLLNFNGPNDTVRLDPDITSKKFPYEATVELIEIAPLTDDEMSGIYTHESSHFPLGGSGLNRVASWSHRLRLDIESENRGATEAEVSDRIITGLRLYDDDTADVDAGPRYQVTPGWLTYRMGIPTITGSGKSLINPQTRGRPYTLADGDVDAFTDFWQQYMAYTDTASDGHIPTALRRFNQSFKKWEPEDRLIDCVIGFEATILSDVPQHESYTDASTVFPIAVRTFSSLLASVHTIFPDRKMRLAAFGSDMRYTNPGKLSGS